MEIYKCSCYFNFPRGCFIQSFPLEGILPRNPRNLCDRKYKPIQKALAHLCAFTSSVLLRSHRNTHPLSWPGWKCPLSTLRELLSPTHFTHWGGLRLDRRGKEKGRKQVHELSTLEIQLSHETRQPQFWSEARLSHSMTLPTLTTLSQELSSLEEENVSITQTLFLLCFVYSYDAK